MIVLKHVTKKFGKLCVLSDVSLRIDPGEFVCITGPSGAGKSTLIHLLVGADSATEGSIEVDGVDVSKVPPSALQLFRRRVGVVFQDHKLLQNRTVGENVAFPLEVCGLDNAAIAKRVPEVLRRMELTQRAKAFPQELSGGEKARTAIARAIVHEPLILLADEPTGNVDPKQSLLVLQLLKDIHKSGTTVILATHDAAIVDTLQTRVIRLERGKVVRDSIGGYEKSSAPMTAKQPAAEPRAFTDAVKIAAEAGAGAKVKITSIGSV